MLALVVTLCLKSDPVHCSDSIVAWLPHQLPETCLIETRARVAEFAKAHPDQVIQHVACMPKRG